MDSELFKDYIRKKISEVDENRDIKEYTRRGRFNFGMNQHQYGHLPSWNFFAADKKKLVKLIWLQAFLSALTAFAFSENWDQEWWKVIIKMLIGATFFTLFFNITSYFSIAFEVNKVQKQVQKLLYEDLLYQLDKEQQKASKNEAITTVEQA